MKENKPIGVIRPEEVAKKLAAIRNYELPEMLDQITENPRIPGALLFLQYMSMKPGGLVKFCEDMAKEIPDRFGTPAMRQAGQRKLSLRDKITIYTEVRPEYRPEDEAGEISGLVESIVDEAGFVDWNKLTRNLERDGERLKGWTVDTFRPGCIRAAMKYLPQHLANLCRDLETDFKELHIRTTEPNVFSPSNHIERKEDIWFMDDPMSAVIAMIGRHAEIASRKLAMTEVSRKVFDCLDYALQERTMVRIVGNPRYGKSESIETYCEMHPGIARVVRVPSSNSLAGLHCAIAEALGIMDIGFASRPQRIKERIEFVLRHTGIFLIMDEAAYLIPQNYTKTTAPMRLNWVRAEIVDRGLPLALSVTPQTFLPAVERFVQKTQYTMEQFLGRTYRVVQLPITIGREDVMAVARIHFPGLADCFYSQFADLARVSKNYLQSVEAISKLARYISKKNGHKRIMVDDIKAAADELIPQLPEPIDQSDSGRMDTPRMDVRGIRNVPDAHRVKPQLTRPERGMKPAREAASAIDLPSGSGAEPRKDPDGTELVLADT